MNKAELWAGRDCRLELGFDRHVLLVAERISLSLSLELRLGVVRTVAELDSGHSELL